MKNHSIGVLIPTMNRPQSLRRTLKSYFIGRRIPDEVIVVDQSQEEDDRREIKEIVEEFASLSKIVYYFQNIPSLTKARNKALSLCQSEILVFSDDDVDVGNDTLTNIEYIMQDSKISMIAGYDELSKVSDSKMGYFLGTKCYRKRHIGYVSDSMLGRFPDKLTEQVPTEWAMGFFFVVRKSFLNAWNIFWDEKLTGYAYAEDLDFSYTYYKHSVAEGLRCIMSNMVIVKHLASKEYRIPSRQSIFMYVINRAYLLYKHEMGKRAEMIMYWCNFWMKVRSRIIGQNYKDYRDAEKKCKELKARLKNGELDPSFYIYSE